MMKTVPRLLWTRPVSIAFFIAASLSLTLLVDQPVRAMVLAHQDPIIYTAMKWLTWLGKGWVLLVLAVGLLLWEVRYRQPAPRKAGGVGVAALVLSGIVVQIVKHLLGRPRPRLADQGVSHWGPSFESGYDSFPSGHAISAFAMAAVLSAVYPKWRGLWYGAAVLVALTRVYTDAHFASDVVAGAILGILVAKAVLYYQQRDSHYAI